MGCTASVLDHTQQQEWIQSQQQISDDATASQKPGRLQEQSVRSHRMIESKSLKDAPEDEEEILADDFLDYYVSKSDESEHTMCDGSNDGCCKADVSVVESIITRMGQSKSVASDDALYEDTSSEDESARGRHLYPNLVDVDVDENDDDDLSKVDSMVTYSVAPGPVDCDDESTFGQLSIGDTMITSSVAPDPIHSDNNEEEIGCIDDTSSSINNDQEKEHQQHGLWKHENKAQHTITDIESLLQSKPSSKNIETHRLPQKLDMSKWQSETNSTRSNISPAKNRSYSPNRIDLSKWEKNKSPTTPKSNIALGEGMVWQPSLKHKTQQPKQSRASSDRAILKNEIALLRQQIQKLERRSSTTGTTTTGRGYVKPSDLVVANNRSFQTEIPIMNERPKIDSCALPNDYQGTNESSYNNIVGTTGHCMDILFDSSATSQSNDGGPMVPLDHNSCDSEKYIGLSEMSPDDIIIEIIEEDPGLYECNENFVDLVSSETSYGNEEGSQTIVKSSLPNACSEMVKANNVPCLTSPNEKQSQLDAHLLVCGRRESLDSTIMQYSVSTDGNDTFYDRSCGDESKQLFGDKIGKPKIGELANGRTQHKVITPTTLLQSSSIVQTVPAPFSDINIEPNVVISNDAQQHTSLDQDSETCCFAAQLDHAVNENILEHEKPASDELLDRTATNDSNVTIPSSLDTTTVATGYSDFAHDTISGVTRASSYQSDETSDGTSLFINLLNLDPWDRDSKLDEKQIFDILETNPSLCSRKHSFDGFHGSIYPLSAMCALSASVSLIKKCYLAFPGAITKADAWVGTSLHYACSYHAPFPVVEYLSKKNPLALKAVNQFNRLPLHMACMFNAEPSVISYLIRKYPGGSKKADQLGMLPLHVTCDSDIGIDSPNTSVVKLLLESFPKACMQPNEAGATPLAISITRRASFSVVKMLIMACPESLSIPDHKNRIPLHLAVKARASTDIIGVLVVTYPSSLVAPDGNNEIPYDWAVRLDSGKPVLDLLEPPDWFNSSTGRHNTKQQKVHIDQ